MSNIAVQTPPSLSAFREHLKEFVTGMLYKLDVNSHKSTPTTDSIPDIIEKLRHEIVEFEEQLQEDMFDENSLLELMDISNFAFLAYVALKNNGVKSHKESVIDEFLDIDIENGIIKCKKARAGSQYKVGQEIKGTNRNGYVDIKLQSYRRKGFSVSVPRSHVVWYKATGKWPIGIIDHINGVKNDDRVSNLRDVDFSTNNLNRFKSDYPFVTKYTPAGREHLKHYNKYVYQRTYKGNNIRVAYFDTPEEASVEGEIKWKRKVKLMFGSNQADIFGEK